MLTGPLHDIRYSPVETLRFVVFIHAAHTCLVSSKVFGGSADACLLRSRLRQFVFVVGLKVRRAMPGHGEWDGWKRLQEVLNALTNYELEVRSEV